MTRYPFNFTGSVRRIEVPFCGQALAFDLDLSVADLNHLKRLAFGYWHMKSLESEQLKDLSKVPRERGSLPAFLEDFLEDSFVSQERLVELVMTFLESQKIVLVSQVYDTEGVRLTNTLLVQNPLFWEVLVSLSEKIALWESALLAEVKKKPSWRAKFAWPWMNGKHSLR